MSIRVDGIRKTFGGFAALDDISLNVPQGELVGLLGPSGSGKTTLLRIIAGLEKPDRGRVLFNERDVTTLDVRRRKVGFVFQQYALFRHLTVADNVAFGLRMLPRGERPGRDAVRARVRELLELVQMDTMAGRYPAQLSGGQKQRVNIARGFAHDYPALLLDGPEELARTAGRLRDLGFEVDWTDRATFPGHERCHAHDAHGNRVELLAIPRGA